MATIAVGITAAAMAGSGSMAALGVSAAAGVASMYVGQREYGPRAPLDRKPRPPSDLYFQSGYSGTPHHYVYGRSRLPGVVIAVSEPRRRSERVPSGIDAKGAPDSVTREFWVADIAAAFLRRPIAGDWSVNIVRLWVGQTLVYDKRRDPAYVAPSLSYLHVYSGRDDQAANTLIEEFTGDAIAYRGSAYVVIGDVDLTPFGNSRPQVSAEWAVEG